MGRRGYRKSPDTRGSRRVEDLAGIRRMPISTFRGPLQAKQFAPDPLVEGGTRTPGGVLNYDDNIAAHPTLDARRAVPNLAIKDKAVDGRTVLHALNDNYGEPNRGIGFRHIEDHAGNRRVIAGPFQNNLASADPQRGIDYYHQVSNSTNTRILSSIEHEVLPFAASNTNKDGERAVGGPAIKVTTIQHYHQADKSTDDRVLASSANATTEDAIIDAQRAAGAGHLKNRAAIKRVIGDEALSEGRQFKLKARPAWMAGTGDVRTLPGLEDAAPVRILRDNLPLNVVSDVELSSTPNAVTEDTIVDALRAAGPGHLKNRAAIKRVIGDEALSEGRQYRLRNRPAWMAGTGQVRGIPGDSDPNPVKVLRDNLPTNVVGDIELASALRDGSANDLDSRRGVGGNHVKDASFVTRHFPTREHEGLSQRSVPQDVWADADKLGGLLRANNLPEGTAAIVHLGNKTFGNLPNTRLDELVTANYGPLSVTTPKLADLSVTTGKIANLAVDAPQISGGAVGEVKLAAAIKNGAQTVHSARTIGSALGGTSLASAAGDHSHGSGNTMDFDFLSTPQRRRALAQRLTVRRTLRDFKPIEGDPEGTVTVEQYNRLLRFVRLLASQQQTLVHILQDAPDLDGFERERRRRRGNLPFPEAMFEWRRHKQIGDRGGYVHQPHLHHYANPHVDLVA
ncbi:MAG: hypothetical protein M3R38_02410 [Actinomycetota bacterium]|nr:hypothetical protein [Actinomycetota bacterium]